jgi:hypothetical protein
MDDIRHGSLDSILLLKIEDLQGQIDHLIRENVRLEREKKDVLVLMGKQGRRRRRPELLEQPRRGH